MCMINRENNITNNMTMDRICILNNTTYIQSTRTGTSNVEGTVDVMTKVTINCDRMYHATTDDKINRVRTDIRVPLRLSAPYD